MDALPKECGVFGQLHASVLGLVCRTFHAWQRKTKNKAAATGSYGPLPHPRYLRKVLVEACLTARHERSKSQYQRDRMTLPLRSAPARAPELGNNSVPNRNQDSFHNRDIACQHRVQRPLCRARRLNPRHLPWSVRDRMNEACRNSDGPRDPGSFPLSTRLRAIDSLGIWKPGSSKTVSDRLFYCPGILGSRG